MGIVTRLSQELIDALEKHIDIQADALRVVLAQRDLAALRGQLKARGLVVNAPETRDGFAPEIWALLDAVDLSRAEQMRLKTLLSEAREQLRTLPQVRMMSARPPKRPGILKPGKEPPRPPRQFVLYQCGLCTALHPWEGSKLCSDPTARYSDVNDYCRRTHVDARDVVVKTWKEFNDDIPF